MIVNALRRLFRKGEELEAVGPPPDGCVIRFLSRQGRILASLPLPQYRFGQRLEITADVPILEAGRFDLIQFDFGSAIIVALPNSVLTQFTPAGLEFPAGGLLHLDRFIIGPDPTP